jgi:hypothetical protein
MKMLRLEISTVDKCSVSPFSDASLCQTIKLIPTVTPLKTERSDGVVPIIQRPSNGLVPEGFGMVRDGLSRRDFTYGIAYYDEKGREDILECKDYVTDIFQNMCRGEKRMSIT